MHRAAAIVVFVTGWIGAALGLVVLVGGAVVVSRATETALGVLDLTDRAITTTDDGLAAAVTAVSAAGAVVEAAGSVGEAAGSGMVDVGPQLEATADVLAGDVADAVGAAVDSLPGVVSSAGVVDQALRVLSAIGLVTYAPDTPFAESLESLRTALIPLPGHLRDQADTLRSVSSMTIDTGESLMVLGDEFAVLAEAVADAERVLGEYGSGIAETRTAVTDLTDQVRALRVPLVVLAVVGGLVLVVGQLVPLLVGWGMLGRGPLAVLGDRQQARTRHDADRVEPEAT